MNGTADARVSGDAALRPKRHFGDRDGARNENFEDVTTITLSYTFFRAKPSGNARTAARSENQTRSVN